MRALFIMLTLTYSILSGITIYEIQYTTSAGGGTYPSPFEGQVVSTSGIVSGIDFDNGRFFISAPEGGVWNGIFVYDNNQFVSQGDEISIVAQVYEYYGFTELNNLESCQVTSSANPVPQPVAAFTSSINSQEEYESVLSQVNNIVVTQTYDDYGEWLVSDGSGNCKVGTGFCSLQVMNFPMIINYPFSSLSGIVSYDWGEYKINPRSLDDLRSFPESYIISTSQQTLFSPLEFELPIQLSFLGDIQLASTYQFELTYNDSVLNYTGYDLNETLSAGGVLQVEQTAAGTLTITFSGDFAFHQVQTLLKLKFSGVSTGYGNLVFNWFDIGNVSVNYFSVGELFLQLETTPIGDTLSIIQRPLQNIPALVLPGEEFVIECLADPATSGWNASLQHNEIWFPLNITNTFYDAGRERWFLTTTVPTPDIYELYDLIVGATGVVTDTCQNAVKIIPEFKEDFYFVHITDSHLPTHIYYPNPHSISDTTEVNDFQAVIRDINLINPEFVLFTGDLVNEGELEDFENRRVYTKAQQLLSEFEVPVFLTSGNHDIGGWDSTPPPQGTARRNWWRFFGWNWLENPPVVEPCYTQNYSFDYGQIHFTGLEAYNNYDNFMYNIYGSDSFTDGQMQWLNDDLQQSSSMPTHVLFYHCDFSGQINLTNLGVDLALWGHYHSNIGSISAYPYDLATKSICDGNRAYRLIYVNDAVLQPAETIYAGTDGQNLQAIFTPENNGLADSVYCSVQNSQPLTFSNALLKFIMPAGADNYSAYGGTITQIDETGEFTVCYVSVEIPANENVAVSVVKLSIFPNPFNPTTMISFDWKAEKVPDIEIGVYNLKGQRIKVLSLPESQNHTFSVVWDGTDNSGKPVSSGIYFVKLTCAAAEASGKMLLIK